MRYARILPAILSVILSATIPAMATDRLSAEVSIEPTILYSNQVFRLTLLIRSQGIALDPNISYNNLFETARIERLDDFKELLPERAVKDGVLWETRRFICPARSQTVGPLELAPTIGVTVVERRPSFFGTARMERPATIQAPLLRLDIRPLPLAGQPPDFSGAVGQFSLSTELTSTNVAVNDLIKIRSRVSGTGYLANIRPPRLAGQPHVKVYEPIPMTGIPAGSVGFEQAVVPQRTDATTIGPITFSFFDPIAGAYRSLSRGPFRLVFHREERLPEGSETRPAVTLLNQEGAGGTAGRGSADRLVDQLIRFAQAASDGTLMKPPATLCSTARARLAPASTALALFDLPSGATVHVVEIHGDWVKVAFNRNRGWIPANAISSAASTAP